MNAAALIAWIVTAGGGFYLLALWLAGGGTAAPAASRFPAPVIFGHVALAAAGLVLWISFVISGIAVLAWTAFGVLVLVGVLGFVMLARWVPAYRGRGAAHAGPGTPAASDLVPAEDRFPVALVAGHGLLAVATVLLALMAALEAGSA